MPTIVEYTYKKQPENLYPWLIISPPHSGPCCFSGMEEIGETQRERRWEYVDARCWECGFAVQVILRMFPDATLMAGLQKALEDVFRRSVPDV